MGKIYLTSDWHFCHNKSFIYEPRGFSSVQEMNEAIIKNFNEIVTPEDTTYCLGDCMLNDDIEGCRCMSRLNGRIYIIAGNHCTTNRWQKYANIKPEITPLGLAYILKYKGYSFYLSHYPTIVGNYDANKPLKQRVIGLCGHVHTQDPFYDADKGLIYHVELDAHGNKPILLNNIIEDIKLYIDKK